MRDLPVYDKEWMKENLGIGHDRLKYPVYRFNNIVLLQYRENGSGDGRAFETFDIVIKDDECHTFLFMDINTKEIFKLKINNEELRQSVLYGYWYGDLRRTLESFLIKLICDTHNLDFLGITRFQVVGSVLNSRRQIMSELLSQKFDLSELELSCRNMFIDYVADKAYKYMNVVELESMGEFINFRLHGKVENNNYVDQKLIFDNIFNLEGEVFKIMSTRSVLIKFLLLKKDYRFSGTYKLVLGRYADNFNEDTFDTVRITIDMLSDREKNLEFITNNMDVVKSLIHLMLERNKTTRKFANYLKLYNLILTTDNVLVAELCFKDGLDKEV